MNIMLPPMIPTALPFAGTMMVCPTSHNDWDWQQSFAGYYACSSNLFGVNGILESVETILQSNNTDFRFSYAEVAFLRQYLGDDTAKAGIFNNTEQFSLLGGGITSPDNQVAHSEVFIRNYLTGHEYLDSIGLTDTIFPVAWLPDDFGHSPQLPILVEALGMKAIGLSRIPGSPQPGLCPELQPAAADVCGNGTSFYWPGRDGSSVLTHFMPHTYYGISNYNRTDPRNAMTQFLGTYGSCVWPGDTVFATEGGDWQYPDSTFPGGDAGFLYNWTGVPGSLNSSVTGQLATFAEFYDTLMNASAALKNFTLFAENYYTGYFASRPQLKIDHYEAAQLLIGAEVLASILTVYNGTTPDMQAALQAQIATGWELLVPTTHHDFVTGTAPDSVYYSGTSFLNLSCTASPLPGPSGVPWDAKGQLSMSNQTVAFAADALNAAMTQLSTAVAWTPTPNIIPVVVFNQLGLDLPDTALVEMDDPSGGTVGYQVVVDSLVVPVQRSSEGKLLFQVPGMFSMAYKIIQLQSCSCRPTPIFPQRSIDNETFAFGNGVLNLTLVQNSGWAISNITIAGESFIQPETTANRIGLWQDSGNLYQFGMEFTDSCCTGTFAPNSSLSAAGPAVLLENGPVRWRVSAPLRDIFGNVYSTQYDLVRGETLIRINTTGAAPHQTSVLPPADILGWSVMASFPMTTANGMTATALEYGTSYAWEDREPQVSWTDGPTFRASHDFAQLVTTQGGTAVGAVYHNGIPAWTINATTLHGVLLRNTPNGGRGASGKDNGTHSQYYTLDVQPQLASSGNPLRTSLYANTPLRVIPLNLSQPLGRQMPANAQLASVGPPDVVLTVGKTANSTLVLRIQRSDPGIQDVQVTLPWSFNAPATIVSALETPIDTAPPVKPSQMDYLFQANRMLMTMKVPLE
ncbi:glycosyl hydrolases family 38 N-terminal domain-containing protein [Mycena galopus ATCC 62051]|nr:glycosyl hydrolases family 38 N-terminal domain-containing protein [Mycena galopus ATCC 62051]